MKRRLLSIILLIFIANLFSIAIANPEGFLPAEKAFEITNQQIDSGIEISWKIASGYYLYRERIKIKVDGLPVNIENWPKSKLKIDEYFGEMQVYTEHLSLIIKKQNVSNVEVHYQGCAEAGLCYPPQKKFFQLNQTNHIPESTQQSILNTLINANPLYTLLAFLGMGAITSFAGCSYPMFPILSRIILGQGKTITHTRSLSLSLAYVLPIAIVYAGLGVAAGLLGKNFSYWLQTPIALTAIATIIGLMALSMLGLYKINIPSPIQSCLSSISSAQRGGSHTSAAIMGFLSAFIISACVVPPMVAATTFIAQSGNLLLGASAMFCFGLGLGLPLILLGLSASWLLPKAGIWMEALQNIMGFFLISAAIWIIARVVPEWTTQLLWGLLLGGIAIWLFKTISGNTGKILGFSCSIASFAIIIFTLLFSFQESLNINYAYIKSEQELHSVLRETDGAVMLDVYADWCVSCKYLENSVFTQPEISQQLKQFKKVKLDLSTMDKNKQATLNKLGVLGPPALLFFSPENEEYIELRVTGKIDAAKLNSILSYALSHS